MRAGRPSEAVSANPGPNLIPWHFSSLAIASYVAHEIFTTGRLTEQIE